jgi:hypothetical protein
LRFAATHHDNDFRAVGEKVNGGAEVVATYDNDGMVASVGALAITRNTATGRIQSTQLGRATESVTFNDFGELSQSVASCGGTSLRTQTLSRDAAG